MTVTTWDDFRLRLDVPPGWLELPLDADVDALQFASTIVADSGEQLDDEARDLVVEDLAGWVLDCRTRDVDFAFAYYPDFLLPALAITQVVAAPFGDGGELTAEDCEREFSEPDGSRLGDPDVESRVLRAGFAVRCQQMLADKDDDDRGGGLIREGVDWAVFPDGLAGMILVTTAWTALALGPELAAEADKFAAGLMIDRG